MSQIKIKNLGISISGKTILDDITTNINKGTITALLGPNGSGKSTLMKSINKVIEYHKGEIEIENTSIKNLTHLQIAQKIAYVPQYEIKISGVKVFDIVLSGRKPYITWGPSERDYQIVSDVIQSLNISHIALKNIEELSGGQQQMVYIARAIAQEPEILLLDEPTNNLDIKNQLEILELIKTLAQKGITIIITVHDINLAIRYADKYLMLKNGKLFASGGDEVLTLENLEKLYQVKIKIHRDNESFFVIPDSLG